MHQAKAWIGNIIVWIILEMPCKGIDKCSMVVAVSGMDNQSRRLVHDKHEVILIDHIDGNIFRYDLKLISRTIHNDAHHIVGFYQITRLDWLTVYYDAFCVSRLLDSVT